MISEELKAIVDKLKEQGKMIFLSETSEEKVTSFEKENSVKLPEKYKEWLLFSDGGELFLPAGIQLYGVEHKPLIDVNDNSRPSEDYVVIGALASGDPILFKKDSEKIAIYNQAAGRIEDDEIYDNFVAFLNDLYDLLGIGG
ncbi:MAG: SMI1/KNR4 family protein [Butyrivibrio crossotus]|nr:SMI1/KNR4 family protein [Butyrivibrio crossotus]